VKGSQKTKSRTESAVSSEERKRGKEDEGRKVDYGAQNRKGGKRGRITKRKEKKKFSLQFRCDLERIVHDETTRVLRTEDLSVDSYDPTAYNASHVQSSFNARSKSIEHPTISSRSKWIEH
jgi:hypothetical protein